MKTAKLITFAIITAMVLAFGAQSFAAEQTTCPVMGGEVSKELYVDVEGKRIYVCCDYCIGEIKKDPSKYIKKVKDNGQELEDAPKE